MKFITRYTDYALQALLYLSSKGNQKYFRVEKVSNDLKLPLPHLRKIFQCLAKNGILKSTRGRTGGFCFLISPNDISMVDIIKIFQGDIDLTHCFVKKNPCKNKATCFIRKRLLALNKLVEKELKEIKLIISN